MSDNFINRILAAQSRQKICRMRKVSGWSYEELSLKSGLTPELLEKLEDGKVQMTPAYLRIILDAYKEI